METSAEGSIYREQVNGDADCGSLCHLQLAQKWMMMNWDDEVTGDAKTS